MRVGSAILSFPLVLSLCAVLATKVCSFVAPPITRIIVSPRDVTTTYRSTELHLDQFLLDPAAQKLPMNDLALGHVDGSDFTLLEFGPIVFDEPRPRGRGSHDGTVGRALRLDPALPDAADFNRVGGSVWVWTRPGSGHLRSDPGRRVRLEHRTVRRTERHGLFRGTPPRPGGSLKVSGWIADAGFFKVFRAIFVARQSPVLPFSVGNYLVGAATSAPIVPALLGTLLGCVPLNCVWVGIGAGRMTTLNELEGDNGSISQYMGILEGVGAIATLLIVLNVGKVILDVSRKGSEVKETS